MAQSSILPKLERELSKPIRSERQVVYILAEIRKYIEHEAEGRRGHLMLLNFFCNWALHVDMYRDPRNIREVLERFDIAEGVSMEDYEISRFNEELHRLRVFRSALGNFLTPKLPSTIITDDIEWERFLFLYLLIISEVPLRYTGKELVATDVVFLELKHEPEEHRQAHFVWNVRLRTGEEYRQGIDYGFDDYGEMIPKFFDGLEYRVR